MCQIKECGFSLCFNEAIVARRIIMIMIMLIIMILIIIIMMITILIIIIIIIIVILIGVFQGQSSLQSFSNSFLIDF